MALTLATAMAAPVFAEAHPAAPHAKHLPAASIRIDAAWVRAAPPGAMMLAGYMTLHNDGDQPVRLVSAQSDAFETVQAHRTLIVGGVSRMRPAGEVTITAHHSLRFEPGGLHLMMMESTRIVKTGDVLRCRLHFSDGSTSEVAFPVRSEAPLEQRRSGRH